METRENQGTQQRRSSCTNTPAACSSSTPVRKETGKQEQRRSGKRDYALVGNGQSFFLFSFFSETLPHIYFFRFSGSAYDCGKLIPHRVDSVNRFEPRGLPCSDEVSLVYVEARETSGARRPRIRIRCTRAVTSATLARRPAAEIGDIAVRGPGAVTLRSTSSSLFISFSSFPSSSTSGCCDSGTRMRG